MPTTTPPPSRKITLPFFNFLFCPSLQARFDAISEGSVNAVAELGDPIRLHRRVKRPRRAGGRGLVRPQVCGGESENFGHRLNHIVLGHGLAAAPLVGAGNVLLAAGNESN